MSKLLVVDASIVGQGDGNPTHQPSKKCREFLEAIRSICHRVAMTPDIRDEWSRHESRYARTWRLKMISLRTKVIDIRSQENQDLRSEIEKAAPDAHIARIMLKDVRLIEAALVADRIVVSLDDKARGHFANASHRVPVLQTIVWINPNVKTNKFLKWLEEGAKPSKAFMLGEGKGVRSRS